MTPPTDGLLARAEASLTNLAGRLRGLAGWRRAICAIFLGMAATCGLPPLHLLPLVVVAFTGLAWQIAGAARWRDAALIGWCFGFGHFVSGLYWIAHALLTDPARYGWMIPFAVGGFAAGLALFAAAAAAATWLTRVRGVARVLVLALAWTATEWVRGHVLTGFPWNLIGTVWTDMPAMAQTAAVIGTYGLSLVTVALAAMPATLATEAKAPTVTTALRRWAPSLAAALALVTLWSAGAARLAGATNAVVGDVRLRLVQPNIPQALKWNRELLEAHFRLGLELSATPASRPPTHLVWSETAVPFNLANEPQRLRALAQVIPRDGLLLTGAIRVARMPDESIRVWNSLHAIDAAARVVATYDKFHLVPFGEYVPFRGMLGLARLAVTSIDFAAGPGPVTLSLPGLPALSPLICYEIIFPGAVVDSAARPGFMLNVTNDAWFGISSGPHQHFAAARMRAIEQGLPLVRAANNGISAVVDPFGRVVARLALGERGVVDSDLPMAIAPPLYARHGDGVLIFLFVAAVMASLGLNATRDRQP